LLLIIFWNGGNANTDPKRNTQKNSTPPFAVAPNYKHAYQGSTAPLRMMLSNYSSIGRAAWTPNSGSVSPAETLGMEYPNGSGIEHIYGGGLWIGGMIDTTVAGTGQLTKVVTTGYEGNGADREFFPGSGPDDKLWIVRDSAKPVGWDSYWGSAIPFKKISDEDFYCRYRDFNTGVNIANHTPLNVEVIQKSFSWTNDYAGALIPIDLTIINQGNRTINNAYIGYFIDTDIGNHLQTTGRGFLRDYWSENFSGYVSTPRMAYAHNPISRGATPIGCVLVSPPDIPDSMRYTYQWLDFTTNNIQDNNDAQRYDNLMARGTVASNQSPQVTSLSDTRFIISFGPFNIAPLESLKIVVALISGADLEELKENATRAVEIHRLGYKMPFRPTSPKPVSEEITFEVSQQSIRLKWDNSSENGWDDSNKIAESFPPNHWRRINPPITIDPVTGDTDYHPRGGRVFEGYRIYRSSDPTNPYNTSGLKPPLESFALLKQVDVDDDNFEFNTGIQYEYTDSNLVRGNTYWYAVTTFSLPNEFTQITSGETTQVRTKPLESYVLQNAGGIVLPFSVAKKKNEVLVVPNPYRVDNDYTFENGGWEGLTSKWQENQRLIRFIHVPEKCVIKIYTLAGDLVDELHHDQADETIKRGEVDWHLLSKSNRAIASGIYIFTVEADDFETQIGKFVIIR